MFVNITLFLCIAFMLFIHIFTNIPIRNNILVLCILKIVLFSYRNIPLPNFLIILKLKLNIFTIKTCKVYYCIVLGEEMKRQRQIADIESESFVQQDFRSFSIYFIVHLSYAIIQNHLFLVLSLSFLRGIGMCYSMARFFRLIFINTRMTTSISSEVFEKKS